LKRFKIKKKISEKKVYSHTEDQSFYDDEEKIKKRLEEQEKHPILAIN